MALKWCGALSSNVARKGALRANIDVSTFRVTFMTLEEMCAEFFCEHGAVDWSIFLRPQIS